MGIVTKDGWCCCFDIREMACILDDSAKLILCPCWRTLEHPVCEAYKVEALDMTPNA